MRDSFRPALAEFVGTLAFVFLSAGAVVADRAINGGLGLLGIALAHGLAFSVFVSVAMPISGGHLNPAVSLGMLVAGKKSAGTVGIYVVAQLLGAVLAAFVLRSIMPAVSAEAAGLGVPRLAPTISMTSGIAIEAAITFCLVVAFFGTTASPSAPKIGGFGVGLALTCGILAGGPMTGAAMNPARAFGPALASGIWRAHAAFWIGPILGALLAGVVWRVLVREEETS